MHPWLTTFAPFSLLHALTVAVLGGAMLAACYLGHRWRETPREARFRRLWAWLMLAYAAVYNTWYILPDNFTWQDSLPLQLCDLAVFVAAAAMLTEWRPARTILYFWGIGLSTQAFFTPTLEHGMADPRFWIFWIGHTMIVGSALYDIIIRGYRPGARDLTLALAVSTTYCLAMFGLDIVMSRWLDQPINYGYVGNTAPDNPTIIDKLGPWPGRVILLALIVIADYIILWAVWPLARRLAASHASA